jgi:protein-S-isoprenylcysteine O-methyltransferase Ste14
MLVYVYVRLAHHEEREVLVEFGDSYSQYALLTLYQTG